MNLFFDDNTEGRLRDFVRGVLDSAALPWELGERGLFTEEEERFIRREADRFLYEPQLPHGGADERKIVEKLRRLSRNRDWGSRHLARMAADKWSEIEGWYYKRQPLMPKRDAEEHEWFTALRKSAQDTRNWDFKWFAELMLDGLPKRVANFKMECKFLLTKQDGKTDRLVVLRNDVGERTGMVELPSEAFSQPSHFREWLLDQGGFCWKAGERELQDLHDDINHHAAWRVVKQVLAVGWYPLGGTVGEFGSTQGPLIQKGIWFLGDTAYDPYGKAMKADEYGIYWFEEQGYMLGERGREAAFLQGKPMMRPAFKLEDAKLSVEPMPENASAAERLRPFFREVCHRTNETLGGLEGMLAIGAMMAYGAAPEIFERYRAFPGIWVHGEASSGKSTMIGWMMSLWGLNLHSGFGLVSNTTTVGLQMLAELYSNLPVWLDEFRDDLIEEYKLGMIRSCCYRDNQAKFKVERIIRTSFIVSGESTTHDAATRSRFPHVQVAASRRLGNHLPWFRDNEQFFFLLTRHLLENRPEYARLALHFLQHWMADVKIGNERAKLVHGIHYAGWAAMVCLLESHEAGEMQTVRQFIATHADSASADVKSEFNVNIFWTDLINAWRSERSDKTLDIGCFHVQTFSEPHPPSAPEQGAWNKYILWIYPEPVISGMKIFLAKERGALTLNRKDLRDQLSKNAYWKGQKTVRFGSSASTVCAWGFDLDFHPLGYQKVDDETYRAYRENPIEGDPRQGPLYALVHDILKKKATDP